MISNYLLEDNVITYHIYTIYMDYELKTYLFKLLNHINVTIISYGKLGILYKICIKRIKITLKYKIEVQLIFY